MSAHAHTVDDDTAVGDVAHTEPHLPHGSWWPLWLALSIALLGLGIIAFGHSGAEQVSTALGKATDFEFSRVPPAIYGLLLLGVLTVGLSLMGWFREDVKWWNSNTGTGLHIPKAGTLLFISSEIFLFGALFAAYFTYKGMAMASTGVWPDVGTSEAGAAHLPIVKTALFSLFLFASSGTIHVAEGHLKRGNHAGFRKWWWLTVVLGAIFLAGQVYEYANLISEGHTLGSSFFITAFYMLTGTHGAHVFGGLCALAVVGWRAEKGQFDAKRHAMPECVAIYWHFVDIVWVFVFGVLYVWPLLAGGAH